MLHIVPQKRPTAAQLLSHKWLWQPPADPTSSTDRVIASSGAASGAAIKEATAALKGAVDATFRAIASPQAANVGPVSMSELAKRRAKDKQNTNM